MSRFAFIVPGPLETVSGGYAYVRAMMAALRDAGHAADAPPPSRLGEVAKDARVVVDGLALPSMEAEGDRIAAWRATALIHHPTALETGHDADERERLRVLETALLDRFARVVATSDATAERLTAAFGVARNKISVVAPGTADAPRSTGSGSQTCEILSVGTLVPRKGHDFLLRALARLFDLDWRLAIVGGATRDPAHARALENLAEELGISQRVTFAGEADDAALEALWRRADIFALATRFEGYGMAIAEALKRGVPPAVTAGGAAGALVTHEAGTVCALNDLDTYSKSLRRMIFDRPLRAEMAEAAWKIGQVLPDWPAQAALFAAATADRN